MALKRNETYPGRFENPTTSHPQGAFRNRSAPNAQDGSYLEQQWANDWDGFFGRLLTVAGITPNGDVDTALASQYYDALAAIFIAGTVPISRGGTGATSAPAARTALGLGSAATREVGASANQIPDMSYFQSSLGANGWERLPSGRIRQWGRVASYAAGAGVAVTFPIPFPTACTGVFQIMIRDTPSTTQSAEVGYSGEPTLTGVQLYHGGSPSWPAFWFAEGY